MSTSQNRRIALCASCDRCRSRKTKCDGNRPCGNCAGKYMKKHRLTSIAGIDHDLFECIYSPAKRRGPVPGKTNTRKADEMIDNCIGGGMKGGKSNLMRMDMAGFGGGQGGDGMYSQNQLAALVGNGGGMDGMGMNQSGGMSDSFALQRQLLMQQQQQLRMQQDSSGMGMNGMTGAGFDNGMGQQNLMLQQQLMMQQMQNSNNVGTHNSGADESAPSAQRLHKDEAPPDNIGVKQSVTKHINLLEKSSVAGNRLRAHYILSIDTLFKLPPVPSDEEYCSELNANMTPSMLPPFDVAALRAARFAEIALGALVSNQIGLALELSNAAVVCLKLCVEEPVHPNCMYDLAKSYFLHGLFRSYRGDMVRYFKYRRVCLSKLTHLSKSQAGIQQLLAAVAFQDAWAYIIYNAHADDLPDIDDVIPQIPSCGKPALTSPAEEKYKVSTDHSVIAGNPTNNMWIQGPPPVFINNEAPPLSRALDALACAVRSCCDQANTKFDNMGGFDEENPSATSLAITANKNELCSRNMVLSAFTLLQQSEASSTTTEKNHGHHLIISAMDAFLDGGEEESNGFTDAQIQSLLATCHTVIEQPHLLFQAGVTYHMISNAAILLCHLMNGLYANIDTSADKPLGDMESALFDEVLDTFISVRKILTVHRRKLPMLLRCHGLPRPNLLHRKDNSAGALFIELGDTHMCASRSCQGFVLMACSPCVAAERAQAAAKDQVNIMLNHDGGNSEDLGSGFDESLSDMGDEFNFDDDALLAILGKIVSS